VKASGKQSCSEELFVTTAVRSDGLFRLERAATSLLLLIDGSVLHGRLQFYGSNVSLIEHPVLLSNVFICMRVMYAVVYTVSRLCRMEW
jgi:hypothetical protein